MADVVGVFPPGMDGRRQVMRAPDEVAAMLRLHNVGWGTRRIAAELGADSNEGGHLLQPHRGHLSNLMAAR